MTGSIQTAQALVAASVSISIAASFVSMSSMNGVFSVANQFQLFMFLPMIPEFFPKTLMAFITGVDFSMISFDFIRLNDLPFVRDLKEWVSFPQKDAYLNEIGLISGSSILNYLSLMAFFVATGIIHILIL